MSGYSSSRRSSSSAKNPDDLRDLLMEDKASKLPQLTKVSYQCFFQGPDAVGSDRIFLFFNIVIPVLPRSSRSSSDHPVVEALFGLIIFFCMFSFSGSTILCCIFYSLRLPLDGVQIFCIIT